MSAAPGGPPERAAAERRLAVLSHAGGLLGVTLVGWVAAAALSGAVLYLAGRRRSRYLALQAGQAALFQLAVLAVDFALVDLLVGGFMYFLEVDLPGLPSISGIYIGETVANVLSILWVVLGIAFPAWHVATLYWSWAAARRASAGRPVAYPLVTRWLALRPARVAPASREPTAKTDTDPPV